MPCAELPAKCGYKVSIPVPDLLYGYSRERELRGHDAAHIEGYDLAGDDDMVYPFLLISFTNECDNMWVATNEWLRGTATCVNIAEQLKHRLQERIPGDGD